MVFLISAIESFLKLKKYSLEAKTFAKNAIDSEIKNRSVRWDDPSAGYNFHAETKEIRVFEQDYKNGMSKKEKVLFESLTRFQQLDYLHSGYLAKTYAENYFPANQLYNGKGDAYRHALWNALPTAKLGANLTQKLTDAHEDKPSKFSYDSKENSMDLFNNQVGRKIGAQSSFMLMMKVMFATDNGELRYLNNLKPLTNQATVNSALIPTNR